MELVHTLAAVGTARRVLDDQKARPANGGPSFNDYLPYVFDCIAAIARTIESEFGAVRLAKPEAERW